MGELGKLLPGLLLWVGGGAVAATVTVVAAGARAALDPLRARRRLRRLRDERAARAHLVTLLRAGADSTDSHLQRAAATALSILDRPATIEELADTCRRAALLARADPELAVAYLVIARRAEREVVGTARTTAAVTSHRVEFAAPDD